MLFHDIIMFIFITQECVLNYSKEYRLMTKHNHSVNNLQNAIDYIEDHIHEKLTLDTIAAAANLSKYHLHRIFKTVTHEKLMDYTRNRKLTHSIHELLHTNLKVIDIAYEYGFEYEQSYIRSFYRLFKMTPTHFRTIKPQVTITCKISIHTLSAIKIQTPARLSWS